MPDDIECFVSRNGGEYVVIDPSRGRLGEVVKRCDSLEAAGLEADKATKRMRARLTKASRRSRTGT